MTRIKKVIEYDKDRMSIWMEKIKDKVYINKQTRYAIVYLPEHPKSNHSGHIYLHRLVKENEIESYLYDYEVVQHIDVNKSNNLPSNLLLKRRGGCKNDDYTLIVANRKKVGV